jgi:deoxyribose-phosphate aldolase
VELSEKDLTGMMDISAVQATDGEPQIVEMVKYAEEYGFKAIHVLPCWVSMLRGMLPVNSPTLTGSSVGYPSGGMKKEVKIFEAKKLIADGVQEIDMMMNIGMLRSGRYRYVEDEIKAIVETSGELTLKVILETCYLTDDEIKKACELSIKGGADFVKTSTGWAHEGATERVISLITSFVNKAIKVKAAGGIRDFKILMKMNKMGVSRFGVNLNSALKIVDEYGSMANHYE